MRKTLIVALYRKESLDSDLFVGIFFSDLSVFPLESLILRSNRDDVAAEFDIAAKLNFLIHDYRHKVEVSFSEEKKLMVDKDAKKKFFFVKPENNFDYDLVLRQIKI